MKFHIFYRKSAGDVFEPREGVVLTLNKARRAFLTVENHEVTFKDLRLEANYFKTTIQGQGAEGAELRVRVYNARNQKPLLYHHYVFDKKYPPRDQFAHGFTGLVYVFHPESGAELRFSCSVGDQ